MTAGQAQPGTDAQSSAHSLPTGPVPVTLAPGTGRLIGLLVSAAFVVILNETIMSVALPRLMAEFSVSAATAQWLSTGFMLTMAVVIPFTGWVMNRFTVRQVFVFAMSTFTIGTVVAGLAPLFSVLLAGRVVQAVGTAIMMPLLMTTVLNVVPVSRRGRVMGIISIVIAVAPAAGPTVGGVILEHLTWRWMFGAVFPIALAALVAGALWVRNVTEPEKIRLDGFSGVLCALGFGGLIFGLSSIGEAAGGHAPVAPWIPLAAGAVFLAFFAYRQVRLGDDALLDLRTLARPTYATALCCMLVTMMSLFGVIILLPMYFQQVLGWTTQESGLALLPGGAAMAVLGYVVGNLYDRVGPRPLLIPGSLLAAGALWGYTFLSPQSTAAFVITLHIVMSVGLSMMFSPLMTTALSSLPRRLYAHGSALLSTLQQVAAAAGTALFITLLTVGTAGSAARGSDQVAATMDGVHLALLAGACVFSLNVVAVWFVKRSSNEAADAH
ncbi:MULTISPECIES: MDR family MFS transporter [Micrococcus]|uniref:DHA2 family efflux MFS transporter permease subunit n=1 Tax=Micrococcus lylae TaxID=1273 RepID=A0ABY2K1V3_9MICC|nr:MULTISPECIES: MDR family MFS transporter [Micrococcus]PNL17211.1 MFS transporter [Micrococcus sp. FDAARGOS_333]TFH99587.1 DHA2 family efflux MFS transporter permease subunit [Micrococcus lylae]